MRNTLLGSALASALALASIAPPLHAAEVADGAVPSTMDDAGTHYIIGATGAHNRNLYTTIVGDLNAVTLTVQNGSILSSSSEARSLPAAVPSATADPARTTP
jgi:hypothetical protein